MSFRNAFLALSLASSFGCAGAPSGADSEAFTLPPGPIQIDPAACLSTATQKISDKAYARQSTLGNTTDLGVETITACSTYRRRYQYGTVFYVYGQAQAYEVNGEIASKYKLLGENTSALGYPTSDEAAIGDGGYFNHFQHGSIYWKYNLGPHALWGAVHDTWMQQGAQANASLGYPIWDQASLGSDSMVSFENGALYYRASTNDVLTLNGTAAGYTAAQVEQLLQAQVAGELGSLGQVQNVKLTSVADYSRGADRPQNRRFTYDIAAAIFPPIGGVFEAIITVTIEIDLDAPNHELEYTLLSFFTSVTGAPVLNQQVANQIHDKLQAQAGVPQKIQALPQFVEDVKPMSDGSVDVFIAPLFHF